MRKEKSRWLHINGHRSEGKCNQRVLDYNVQIKKMRTQIRRKTYDGRSKALDPSRKDKRRRQIDIC